MCIDLEEADASKQDRVLVEKWTGEAEWLWQPSALRRAGSVGLGGSPLPDGRNCTPSVTF